MRVNRAVVNLEPRNNGHRRRRTSRRGQRPRLATRGRVVPIASRFHTVPDSFIEIPLQDEPSGVPEQTWLRTHGKEFAGRWVALDGGQLVGEGSSAREALQKARSSGSGLPFLVYVETGDLPFGGW